ncbi:MAG: exopolysaccharide biosynthesis polyprenyl glycosylphosphotransferase [Candidatus Omnitrophica bacterium]|nr:exopolysaccharide biosynthesis polyprenyl glycosylphosphotransferase [Candidatus Omnitrophota bacterium]
MSTGINIAIPKTEVKLEDCFAGINQRFYEFLKRSMDIFGSALALTLAMPLMLFIAILIKLTSPGPIFYKQQRCTKNGKEFWLYKFRSMPDNIENGNGPKWGKTDDPRCNNFGRILRLLLIDELPQLINVLKGDMSLVGPRPERPFFIEKFRKSVKDYDLRHNIKAGLTGWAQVNGYRGNTSIVKRIEHDLFYMENRSICFDLKIILMTPFSIRLAKLKSKQ